MENELMYIYDSQLSDPQSQRREQIITLQPSLQFYPSDLNQTSVGFWGDATPSKTVKSKAPAKRSPSQRIRKGWQRTSVQVNFTNYRGAPIEFCIVIAYVIDGKSGERVLLGTANPIGSSTSGTTGVVTFANEPLPSEGTLVLRVVPEYMFIENRTITRGEFVGDVLDGSIAWKRNRTVKIYNATQETAEVTVKARTHEEAETILKSEGKVGLVIGPVQLGGGVGKDKRKLKGEELEIEYKAKVALPSLKIVMAQ